MQSKRIWTTSNVGREVERVQQTVLRSPKKSERRTRLESLIPATTVWREVRKRFLMKPYNLLLVQAITQMISKSTNSSALICKRNLKKRSSVSVLCSVVRPHFIRLAKLMSMIFAFEVKKSPCTIEHEKDSPKMNVFCAISKNHVHGPFFFEVNVTVDVYMQLLQN